jgi:hypothetical protein
MASIFAGYGSKHPHCWVLVGRQRASAGMQFDRTIPAVACGAHLELGLCPGSLVGLALAFASAGCF